MAMNHYDDVEKETIRRLVENLKKEHFLRQFDDWEEHIESECKVCQLIKKCENI